MTILLTLVHIVVSLILILVVLLQTGKRADLAGAFGGGGSQTAFGARGAATFLSKMTTAAAIVFMLTSLGLSLVSSRATKHQGGTVLPDEEPPASGAPAVPGSTPATPPAGESPAPGPAGEAGTGEATPAQSPAESPDQGSAPEPGGQDEPGRP